MKFILFLLLFISSGFALIAQDTIVTVAGDEIVVKIEIISSTEVQYYRIEMLDGPLYIKKLSEIFMIKLSNGTKFVYDLNSLPSEQAQLQLPDYSAATWYRLGAEHADEYYPGKNALIATSFTTLFAPIAIIPLLIYYTTSNPKFDADKLPNPEYYNQEQYREAFTTKAKNKNIGNALAGTLLGILPFIIYAFLMSSQ